MTFRRMMWFAVGLLAVMLIALKMEPAEAAYHRAPVVVPVTDGLMRQVGWHTYEAEEHITMLYCVKHSGHVLLDCVIYIELPAGAGITLVTGVVPSEGET